MLITWRIHITTRTFIVKASTNDSRSAMSSLVYFNCHQYTCYSRHYIQTFTCLTNWHTDVTTGLQLGPYHHANCLLNRMNLALNINIYICDAMRSWSIRLKELKTCLSLLLIVSSRRYDEESFNRKWAAAENQARTIQKLEFTSCFSVSI